MGVTMALPWLESANVWGDEPKKNRPASEAPVRVAALFSGNGFHSKEWWAKGEGKDMELGKVLAPFAVVPPGTIRKLWLGNELQARQHTEQ